jgi:hypothetical protein
MMEVPQYLTIITIAIGMTFGALGLFMVIMIRYRGPYRAGHVIAHRNAT